MAGDWIKMRGNLWDDPRVARIIDLTDSSEAAVIGALYWLWATADQHTEDGCMPGLTLRQIDRKTGVQGFGAALVAINWLRDDPQGVVLVSFEEHNGESAKRRCSDAKRKAGVRTLSESSRTDCGQDADDLRRSAELEKEKSREEKKEEKPTAAPWLTVPELVSDGLSQNLSAEWLAHRRSRKAKLTRLAWDGFKAEVKKAGWQLDDAIRKAISRNWTAFEADWVKPAGFQAVAAVTVPSIAADKTAELLKADEEHRAEVARQRALRQQERAA